MGRMRKAILTLVLAACAWPTASEPETDAGNCGPASAAYLESTRAGCQMPDGGYLTEADGRVAPTLIVCTDRDGSVLESWCQ
jgi:hypothetical protein